MSRYNNQDSPLIDSRYLWAGAAIVGVFAILSIRLWYLQVYRGDHYHRVSINNRIRRIEIPAARGMIFDRHGEVILGNRPFFDLVYIPQYVRDRQKTLQVLSNLLGEPITNFERMLGASYGRPKFLPITIKRNLSLHEVSIIESNKVFLAGVDIATAPRRDYTMNTPAHLVGYIGEISARTLRERNAKNPKNPYLPGDLIGKQGLESRWESLLRGQRGYRLIQVDAFGRQTSILDNQSSWDLPVKPAVPGSDLILAIDIKLQDAVKRAFQGKYGAVVALDPRSGEVQALLSSPDFDPRIYQDGVSYDKWQALISDPYKPLFDKTTGGAFPPGSIYKPVVAIAALEEGLVTPSTTFHCPGSFELGKDVFHCHHRGGHGTVDLEKAMTKSCDVYFYHIGMELGADKIAKYARALGLGRKLGIKLNKEDPGLIPSNQSKGRSQTSAWTVGDTPPLSIGQGANLLTPLQIASLYATLGNEGKIWKPIVVRQVINHIGETIVEHRPKLIGEVQGISRRSFRIMKDILTETVMSSHGSGHRAQVPGVTVAGKTGSAQVVSLKKNRNRKESVVSMKWQEHAMFAAFSPVDNPEIAVAVISENDRVGGGALSAAPVAGEIIKAYWDLKKRRLRLAEKESSADASSKR